MFVSQTAACDGIKNQINNADPCEEHPKKPFTTIPGLKVRFIFIHLHAHIFLHIYTLLCSYMKAYYFTKPLYMNIIFYVRCKSILISKI